MSAHQGGTSGFADQGLEEAQEQVVEEQSGPVQGQDPAGPHPERVGERQLFGLLPAGGAQTAAQLNNWRLAGVSPRNLSKVAKRVLDAGRTGFMHHLGASPVGRATLDTWVDHVSNKALLRMMVEKRYDVRSVRDSFSAKALKRLYNVFLQVPRAHVSASLDVLDRTYDLPVGDFTKNNDQRIANLGYLKIGPFTAETLTSGLANRLAQTWLGKKMSGIEDAQLDNTTHAAVAGHTAFDHVALHELGHGVDDVINWMGAHGGEAIWGAWETFAATDAMTALAEAWGVACAVGQPGLGDDMVPFARAQVAARIEATKLSAELATALVQGEMGDLLTDEQWADLAAEGFLNAFSLGLCRGENGLWAKTGKIAEATHGGRVFHQGYEGGEWFSYNPTSRGDSVTWYQFRAPAEFFAECYATYYLGGLAGHPTFTTFRDTIHPHDMAPEVMQGHALEVAD